MICPNQPLVWDAYSRLGSAGDPFRWYISQPAKCGPLTSHFSRLPSDVRMNAPLRVPTRTRTPLIPRSFSFFIQPNLFIPISFTAISSLQTFDVNLGHLQHGFENPVRFYRVFVMHQFKQHPGDDLPRYAKFVLQPCALHFSSARGELVPQLIHFCLRLAVYKERYGRRKSVVRATVQRHELLPFELESHRHHGSFRSRSRFSVAGDVQDFRVLEDGSIKVRRLFGLAVKPKERGDLLHMVFLFSCYAAG